MTVKKGLHTIVEERMQWDALRRERDEALEANRVKSRFLANMSHELRTPLNGVVGMADLLLVTPLDDEQKEYVEIIRTSSAMLLRILSDLQDISRIENSNIELNERPFDVESAFAAAMAVASGLAAQKPVRLGLELDRNIPAIAIGDPDRLQQILVNLLNNAVKFTAKGEVVMSAQSLGIESDGFRLGVTVRDTGIGMDESVFARIFLPFQQADATTINEYGGSGLGLAICKTLVELMDGTITVQSRKGIGSAFSFNILLRT